MKLPFLTLLLLFLSNSCNPPQNKEINLESNIKAFDKNELLGDWQFQGRQITDNTFDLSQTNLDNALTTGLQFSENKIYILDYPYMLEGSYLYSTENNKLTIEELYGPNSFTELEIRNDSLIMNYKQPNQQKRKDFYTRTRFDHNTTDHLKEFGLMIDSLVGTWVLEENAITDHNEDYGSFPRSIMLSLANMRLERIDGNEHITAQIDEIIVHIKYVRGSDGRRIWLTKEQVNGEKIFPATYAKQ